ncbi:MAG: hypothetical protein ACPGUV_12120 [Polyangiales bacterium]
MGLRLSLLTEVQPMESTDESERRSDPTHSWPAPVAEVEAVCPVCQRAFFGLARCPEHGLPLRLAGSGEWVDALPPAPRAWHQWPRLWLSLVPWLWMLAFFALPFLHYRPGPTMAATSATALQMTHQGAMNLWVIPAAALGLWQIVWRRRDLAALGRVWPATFLLAFLPAVSVLYSYLRVRARSPLDASSSVGLGLVCVLLVSVGALVCSVATARAAGAASGTGTDRGQA